MSHFTYLGQLFTENGKNDKEIKRRIEIARNTFNRMKPLLTSRKLQIKTRIRLLKCYVYSILLYGAETWTISKKSSQRIKSFETWCLRRILKVSWTEKKTNQEIFKMSESRPELIQKVVKLKMKYAGHIMRHNSLQKALLEGMVEGKRARGRQRMTWMTNIMEWSGTPTYSECCRVAEDRDRWRSVIADALEEHDTNSLKHG